MPGYQVGTSALQVSADLETSSDLELVKMLATKIVAVISMMNESPFTAHVLNAPGFLPGTKTRPQTIPIHMPPPLHPQD